MNKRKITNSKNQWIDIDECTQIEGNCRFVNGNKTYYRADNPHIYNCLFITKNGKFVEFTNYSVYGSKSTFILLSDEEAVEWFNENEFEIPEDYPQLKEIENSLKL
jgi:hypothetical protein